MALRRLIACCLGIAAAALLMLGCGSGSDSTSADIDPAIASDLSGQLDRIQAFFDEGNCHRASGAVETLGQAVDAVSGQSGQQFTADAQELVDNLRSQVDDECQAPEQTTTTTSSTDTAPIVTDTEPSTTTDTSPSTTSTKSTSTSTSTSSAPTPPTSTGNGNGNGQPNPPGGGINPEGKERHR